MVASPFSAPNASLDEDRKTLVGAIAAVIAAGDALRDAFDANPRPRDFDEIRRLMDGNDAVSLGILRDALLDARPNAQWCADEDAVGALPPGEWWVTDPVEGNINKAHGLIEFSVTATLVRDNVPVLTAVHLPMVGDTFAAVAGGGATQNAVPLRVSDKTALAGAFVATAQNGPRDAPDATRRLGASVTAMLDQRAIVRVSPPPTLQLVQVAAGRLDLFWQYQGDRAGLISGALMVSEAGGILTEVGGAPWTMASTDICAAAPGVHPLAIEVLAAVV